MIEICESWDEFLDWAWHKDLFIEGEWGQQKKIHFELRDDLQAPFHHVVFEEYKTIFDDKPLDFDLSHRQQFYIIKAFWDMRR